MNESDRSYISRAGLKLEHALREFRLDVGDYSCADFGCNVGGFTDCLLQHGAATVYAIDTGYGTLDWRLRNDPRVIVMERTNALHAVIPSPAGGGAAGEGSFLCGPCDLVVIDLGWTKQQLAVLAALRWLKPGGGIITLVKPHYEATAVEKREHLTDGALPDDAAAQIAQRVLDGMPSLGVSVVGSTQSPIRGGKSSRRSKGGGNVEFLALLKPVP